MIASSEINKNGWKGANKTANTFELQDSDSVDVDGTAWKVYASGGAARRAVTTLGGLWHLEGEDISALANGNEVTGLTVTGGQVTLPNAASRVHAGIPYVSDIETINPEGGAGTETIQGRKKNISNVVLRVEDTRGVKAGPSPDKLYDIRDSMNTLVTGDIRGVLRPNWNTGGRVFIRQTAPLPMTILAFIPEIDLED